MYVWYRQETRTPIDLCFLPDVLRSTCSILALLIPRNRRVYDFSVPRLAFLFCDHNHAMSDGIMPPLVTVFSHLFRGLSSSTCVTARRRRCQAGRRECAPTVAADGPTNRDLGGKFICTREGLEVFVFFSFFHARYRVTFCDEVFRVVYDSICSTVLDARSLRTERNPHLPLKALRSHKDGEKRGSNFVCREYLRSFLLPENHMVRSCTDPSFLAISKAFIEIDPIWSRRMTGRHVLRPTGCPRSSFVARVPPLRQHPGPSHFGC